MSDSATFKVTYWGTTGSLTAPLLPEDVTNKLVRSIVELQRRGALAKLGTGPVEETAVRQLLVEHLPYHLRSTYGGNTSCIEIQTPDSLIVLDSGSGFRVLGIDLTLRWDDPNYKGDRRGHVLLTHSHMDHTYATPFVDPYYDPRNHFTIWAAQPVLDSLHAVLDSTSSLRGVYFPPTFDFMAAIKEFQAIEPGKEFKIGATKIRSHPLNHPGGCLAFRFELNDRALVFASDHEQLEDPDRELAAFAKGADLFYADAQYLAQEYHGKVGIHNERPLSRHNWGHSTVEGVVATALAAGVRRLHLGHHEPKRRDDELAAMEDYAKELLQEQLKSGNRSHAAFPIKMVYEGMTLEI